MAPTGERVLAGLGEAEIVDVARPLREPVEPQVQRLGRALHLGGAQGSEDGARLAADVVLAALAAGGAGVGKVPAASQAEGGEHAAGLVVGMGAGLHERADRAQRRQRPRDAQDAGGGGVAGDALAVVQWHRGSVGSSGIRRRGDDRP